MSEEVRIGVYICHCGLNIAGVVDVKKVVEYAKTLPGVVVAKDYVFMCSAPGQDLIKEDIKKYKLNRVVVSACSPTMHEPTFRNAVAEGGLNPYLFEMANIREHCSWVHPDEKEEATEKAKELVRMAVAKAKRLEPLEKIKVEVNRTALVLGGGVAGMRAALDLADRGFEVYLVEKRPVLGGHAARLDRLAHTSMKGLDVVGKLVEKVKDNPKVHLMLSSRLEKVDGSVGHFKVVVRKAPRYVDPKCDLCGECEKVCPVEVPNEYEYGLTKRKAIYLPFKGAYPPYYVVDMEACTRCGECLKVCKPKAINLDLEEEKVELEVGAIITAIGYKPYEPPIGELGYKTSGRVLTLFQFKRMLDEEGPTSGKVMVDGVEPKSVAFIMCVGSMNTTPNSHPYCSRMCCSSTMQSILQLKERRPEVDVYVLYRDMRTYGLDEVLYWKASENEVKFLRYEGEPKVRASENEVEVELDETTIQERVRVKADLLVLVNGMEPPEDVEEVRNILKVGCGSEGFLKEAHLKLRPVEALTDGVFLAGSVSGPRNVVESITAGSAAAAKASGLLAKEAVEVEPLIASVIEEKCSGCGVCSDLCPYEAITIKEVEEGKRRSEVNPALCKGCGTCVAACPSAALQQAGFKDDQIWAQILALKEVV